MLKSLPLTLVLKCCAVSVVIVAIAGCGGRSSGSTGSMNSTWQKGTFEVAENYANQCAVPRTGIDLSTQQPFPDKQATFLEENNFLRSWSNDTYLWYDEIEDQDPYLFPSTAQYFNTLKTMAKTASGKNKDNFHFTYKTTVWDGLINSGVDTGYGITWASAAEGIPRNVVVSYTEPGSPAANSNLQRGARLLKVDGVDFLYSNNVDALNAGLFPSAHGESHSFEVQDYGSDTPHTIVLVSGPITKVPVQNVNTIDTASGKVGYFLFNDHLATAEQELIDAVNQLAQNNVSDLVLDVRYNGGGYLYIASELAYMIAGQNATANKIFEKTTFNNKHTQRGLSGEVLQPMGFLSTSDTGDNLPSLNLHRVYIITSGDTCSASESIINSLRGVDVEVIQIGAKTCGKPYGFFARDNCGTTYFSIQFKGVNNKGFGEYSDGFTPSEQDNGLDNIKGCESSDDFTHLLGDANELNLASALHYRETGTCPAASESVKLQKLSLPGLGYNSSRRILNKEVGLTNRIMR